MNWNGDDDKHADDRHDGHTDGHHHHDCDDDHGDDTQTLAYRVPAQRRCGIKPRFSDNSWQRRQRPVLAPPAPRPELRRLVFGGISQTIFTTSLTVKLSKEHRDRKQLLLKDILYERFVGGPERGTINAEA
jgi:hypothetical protein